MHDMYLKKKQPCEYNIHDSLVLQAVTILLKQVREKWLQPIVYTTSDITFDLQFCVCSSYNTRIMR